MAQECKLEPLQQLAIQLLCSVNNILDLWTPPRTPMTVTLSVTDINPSPTITFVITTHPIAGKLSAITGNVVLIPISIRELIDLLIQQVTRQVQFRSQQS
jgi:hypothetical protein